MAIREQRMVSRSPLYVHSRNRGGVSDPMLRPSIAVCTLMKTDIT